MCRLPPPNFRFVSRLGRRGDWWHLSLGRSVLRRQLRPGTLIGDTLGGSLVGNAIEDDGSLVRLTDQSKTGDAVKTLEANETEIGAGQIFSGETLKLLFNDPLNDPRTPDNIVVPNIGANTVVS